MIYEVIVSTLVYPSLVPLFTWALISNWLIILPILSSNINLINVALVRTWVDYSAIDGSERHLFYTYIYVYIHMLICYGLNYTNIGFDVDVITFNIPQTNANIYLPSWICLLSKVENVFPNSIVSFFFLPFFFLTYMWT